VQTAPLPQRISEIQSALAAQGVYKGQPNGKWDVETAQAVRDFQSAHGLTGTGKLDALTLQKLGLGSEIAGRAAPWPSHTPEATGSPQQTP
jgi:peptidoglycan hydrolase-like protein with peptidoglycan-binding domain